MSNITPVAAKFQWDAMPSPVTTYVVSWKYSGTNTWLNSANSPTNSITIYQFQPDKDYDVQVRSWCPSINMLSPYTTSTVFHSTYHPICTTPTNVALVGSPTATSATVTWDNMPGTTSYVARWREVGTTTWSAGGGLSNPRQLAGLLPGKNYEFQVASWCGVISQLTAYSSLLNFSTPSLKESPSVSAEVLAFDGKELTEGNELHWITSLEKQHQSFRLLHSKGNEDFTLLAEIPSKANGGHSEEMISYTYFHTSPDLDINSYKLELVDLEGNQKQDHRIVSLNSRSSMTEFSLYPNPTSSEVYVNFKVESNEEVVIKIQDLTGRMLSETHIAAVQGENNIPISLNEIADGLYLVQVIENGKMSFMSKVQKQTK